MSESAAQPAPTPFEKFRAFAQRIVSVPKRDVDALAKKQRAAKANKKTG
jgi:hypothetical protein